MGTSESLHILHVLECFSAGSREILRLLSTHQIERGHAVTVVCGVDATLCEDYSKGFRPEVRFRLVTGWGDRRPASSVRALLQLRRAVSNLNPDIVHLHSSIAGFIGRIALSFRGRSAMVYTPHGFSLQRPGVSKLHLKLYGLAEQLANRLHPAVYVACSESERRVIAQWNGRVPLQMINNGIDAIERARVAVAAVSSARQYVSVGRLCDGKNQIELIALKQALGVGIIAVGDGELALKSALSDAGIPVTGWLSREQLIEQLSGTNTVLLQPSLSEGLPVSVLEAFSLRVPVVARRSPGHVDVIDHGRNGLLYDTPEDLINLVKRIEAGEYNLENMVSNAHTDFGERYTAVRMGDDYLQCYWHILRH